MTGNQLQLFPEWLVREIARNTKRRERNWLRRKHLPTYRLAKFGFQA